MSEKPTFGLGDLVSGMLFVIVVATLILGEFVPLMHHPYSAADVRKVCVHHAGVVQMSDHSRVSLQGHIQALVVCKDGWVGRTH